MHAFIMKPAMQAVFCTSTVSTLLNRSQKLAEVVQIVMKRTRKTDATLALKRATRSKYFEPSVNKQERTGLHGNCDVPVIPFESELLPVVKVLKKRAVKGGKKRSEFLDDQGVNKIGNTSRLLHTSTAHCSSPAVNVEPLTIGAERYRSSFYDVPCQVLAKQLLGQVLVRQLDDGTTLSGRIVETECYLGGEDKASHTFNGRMTEACMPMYMKPGTAYVYMTYGMYHCFNISSQEPGAAVLLRALEPLQGHSLMLEQRLKPRGKKPDSELAMIMEGNRASSRPVRKIKPHQLCNGPSKLCMSLMIDKKTCNTQDMSEWPGMWIEKSEDAVDIEEHQIVKTSRIGIDSAGIEWASKPLRFYVIDQDSVSRRDLIAENQLREVAALLKK